MEVFEEDRFIIKYNLEDIKDTDVIMDMDMNTLCRAKRQQSWTRMLSPSFEKIPVLNKLVRILSRNQQMKTTHLQLERVDETLLGEIHETPVFKLPSMIRKWQIYNAKGEYEGAVKEKPKAWGSDWVLEDAGGKVVAMTEGNRKEHDYQVIALDKQVIARCHPRESGNNDSYEVDMLPSDFDPLLVLSYILVLAYASAWRVGRSCGARYSPGR